MTPFFYDRLADYVRAVNALGATEDVDAQRAIAQILGLAEPPSPALVQKAAGGAGVASTPLPPEPGRRDPQTPKTAPAPSAASAPRPRKRKPVSYTVETATAAARERPSWLDEPDLLEPPRAEAPPPARPVPLLRPRWSRAILSTAMATRTEINQVDVAAVLDAEVQGRLLRRIPRRIVPSLARGVQVLVDRGPSSEPFRADHELLVDQIRSVGGRETVSVVELDSSRDLLATAGDDSGDYFARFRPPPGVVVVLVSDLGIVRVPFEETALPADWLRFVTRLRAGGNPVIAFVPFGPRRWPPDLARTMAMVQWDRATNVQAVRRAMRRALR
ncbi:MAG TPA: hypothetical protein VEK57_05765 [Thermoanaerobaculia bacterium]|nr:hypothetical protein [Thermoanaerobaculia bacterium]